jgi:hypothetical protein
VLPYQDTHKKQEQKQATFKITMTAIVCFDWLKAAGTRNPRCFNRQIKLRVRI